MLKYPELEDLPMFTSGNKKIIPSIFIEGIVKILEKDKRIYQILAKFISALLPDDRPSLLSQIKNSCEELKDEISKQTPEISKLIENIRTNTP